MDRWVAVSIGLALQFGCSLSPDPAIRLADCVKDAVDRSAGSLASWANCDLKMRGSYLIVLHPQGYLSDDQLISAGLPKSLLPEFRALRIGERPAIYVIATGPDVSGVGSDRTTLSSWTTSPKRARRLSDRRPYKPPEFRGAPRTARRGLRERRV